MSTSTSRVTSPCVQVCQMDDKLGLCRGCRRTLREIAEWVDMTPSAQRDTLLRVAERRRALREPSD